MLTIFEELVSVAICSRSNLRSTGLYLSACLSLPVTLVTFKLTIFGYFRLFSIFISV